VSETEDIIAAFAVLQERGEPAALATVVSTRGSAYRGSGARLLMGESGQLAGNISGGCLEADVEEAARALMESGAPRLMHFDVTAEDDALFGYGLGCAGVIDVFVEPASTAKATVEALRLVANADRPMALVTVLESEAPDVEPGARLLVEGSGQRLWSLGDPAADVVAQAAALPVLENGATVVRVLDVEGRRLRTFIEAMLPPLRLLVCGAGHDAVPLVRSGVGLGWRVSVADDRKGLLAASRFPGVFALVEASTEQLAQAVALDRRTHAVVMTHNYLRDKGYLRSLLGSDVAYIGLLGPRRRSEKMLAELEAEGISAGDPDRIHAPAGLDLGADGPEEVAWAIVAEVLAVHRGRTGGFLRERSGPIHSRTDEVPVSEPVAGHRA